MGFSSSKDKKTYGRSMSEEGEDAEDSAEDELHDKEARKVCNVLWTADSH